MGNELVTNNYFKDSNNNFTIVNTNGKHLFKDNENKLIDIKYLKPNELTDSYFTLDQFKSIGYTNNDLIKVYLPNKLKDFGVTPKQFKDDNVKLGDILKYDLELYSIKELIDGGYIITDFKLLFNL